MYLYVSVYGWGEGNPDKRVTMDGWMNYTCATSCNLLSVPKRFSLAWMFNKVGLL